jgi:hypothetical protein
MGSQRQTAMQEPRIVVTAWACAEVKTIPGCK